MQKDVVSIEEMFGNWRDPRSRAPPQNLTEMWVVALCAILSGADSEVAIRAGLAAALPAARGLSPTRREQTTQ